jgi:peroxisomal 2,4-dienoyl-CoA reductase
MSSSPFHKDCLKGKIALVTGGGSGICFEIVKQLLLHGCAGAVICGRRENFLKRASEELTRVVSGSARCCLYKVCDVRDPRQCQAAVDFTLQSFGGRLDVLVNGAAGNFLATAESLSPKGFKTVLEIDTIGTFQMVHACYKALKQSSSPSNTTTIINISATLHLPATHYQVHASAAKAAIDSLTRSLALEWGQDGIRVCGIAPGPIRDTPGTTKLAPGVDSDSINEMIQEGIPLQRMGTTFDIAMAAVFLCSDAGSYITGDTLIVDGGQYLYKPPMVPREMVAELSRKVEAKSRSQAPKMTSKL